MHYMREWNPAIEKQATDRCYRIGQERPVHVHTIVCTSQRGETVEQRLAELLAAKRRLITEFTFPMGGFEVSPEELAAASGWSDDDAAVPQAEPRSVRAGRFEPEVANVDALASRVAGVGLPSEVVDSLDVRARAALVVLADNGDVRATDLGAAMDMSTGRVSMFMTRLRRELHQAGVVCFDASTASDGEPRYTWTGSR